LSQSKVKKTKTVDTLALVLRLVVGLVFAYAGLMKLLEPIQNFTANLQQYSIIPESIIPLAALIIPWCEWIGGMCLILGYFTRASAALVLSLAGTFIVILGASILTGTAPENCGCFGANGLSLSGHQMLILDCFNAVVAIWMILRTKHLLTVDERL